MRDGKGTSFHSCRQGRSNSGYASAPEGCSGSVVIAPDRRGAKSALSAARLKSRALPKTAHSIQTLVDIRDWLVAHGYHVFHLDGVSGEAAQVDRRGKNDCRSA